MSPGLRPRRPLRGEADGLRHQIHQNHHHRPVRDQDDGMQRGIQDRDEDDDDEEELRVQVRHGVGVVQPERIRAGRGARGQRVERQGELHGHGQNPVANAAPHPRPVERGRMSGRLRRRDVLRRRGRSLREDVGGLHDGLPVRRRAPESILRFVRLRARHVPVLGAGVDLPGELHRHHRPHLLSRVRLPRKRGGMSLRVRGRRGVRGGRQDSQGRPSLQVQGRPFGPALLPGGVRARHVHRIRGLHRRALEGGLGRRGLLLRNHRPHDLARFRLPPQPRGMSRRLGQQALRGGGPRPLPGTRVQMQRVAPQRALRTGGVRAQHRPGHARRVEGGVDRHRLLLRHLGADGSADLRRRQQRRRLPRRVGEGVQRQVRGGGHGQRDSVVRAPADGRLRLQGVAPERALRAVLPPRERRHPRLDLRRELRRLDRAHGQSRLRRPRRGRLRLPRGVERVQEGLRGRGSRLVLRLRRPDAQGRLQVQGVSQRQILQPGGLRADDQVRRHGLDPRGGLQRQHRAHLLPRAVREPRDVPVREVQAEGRAVRPRQRGVQLRGDYSRGTKLPQGGARLRHDERRHLEEVRVLRRGGRGPHRSGAIPVQDLAGGALVQQRVVQAGDREGHLEARLDQDGRLPVNETR
mmetsp:Transcript_3246/g.6724  ORF Transcript_3246/g.6724 Transcript_3246/m.6724 type:complete len:636 (+) Transcript_3246:193-2100(+)